MKTWQQRWSGIVLGVSTVCLIASEACAQLTVDNTLGTESSTIVQPSPVEFEIRGGAQRGANLFHSFREFNVPDGGNVYFANPIGVQNILSRVTGNTPSNIEGGLGVLGNANLFLLNPNGIIFGPGARLDVRGSFIATTANAIQFGEQGFFSATSPEAPSLLTVNPSAFWFNQINASPIGTRSAFLKVPDGQNLLLLGGDVGINGGSLDAWGGRIDIGGVANTGRVEFNSDGSLSFSNAVERANIAFTNQALLDVRLNDRGNIAITGRNITISNSQLRAGIIEGVGDTNSQAGDLTLNATGDVRVEQNSRLRNNLNSDLVGNAGNIIITANSLALTGGSQLTTSTFGQGNSGDVMITAYDSVLLDGINANSRSTIFSTVEAGAVGTGGDIRIAANALLLGNGARLLASTLGQGDAGNIFINADRVSLDGNNTSGQIFTTIRSAVERGAVGNSGDIHIMTHSLDLLNRARLAASTLGQGDAGNVIIDARDHVSLTGGDIFSTAEVGAEGNGGDIRITTGSLSITNGSQLISSTSGRGNAGNITIDARDRVSLEGDTSNSQFPSAIFSDVGEGATGNGGIIRITTNSLHLADQAKLDVNTSGWGNAGNIFINATGSLFAVNGVSVSADSVASGSLREANSGDIIVNAGGSILPDGSTISNNLEPGVIGAGGTIQITTSELSLLNGAQVQANLAGQGNSGDIIVNVRDRISLDGRNTHGLPSSIASGLLATGQGQAGNIRIGTGSLMLINGAQIAASSQGQGDAGNIAIEANGPIELRNAGILNGSEGGAGNGGNITITADSLSLLNRGQILTSVRGLEQSGNLRRNAGAIALNIRGAAILDGVASQINSGTGAEVEGNGGQITLNAGSLSLLNQGNIQSSVEGQGDAGSIALRVDNALILQNGGRISSLMNGTVGQGGDINIQAASLAITNVPSLSITNVPTGIVADSYGQGNAGDITISTRDFIRLSNSGITSSTAPTATGNSGNITLSTRDLVLTGRDTTLISTASSGQGSAGNIQIRAHDRIAVRGESTSIESTLRPTGRGRGGNITINTNQLALAEQANLISSTLGQGNAGNINLNSRDRISLNNSSVFSSVERGGVGAGGDIRITTNSLSLINGSQLVASTSGQGNAGDVTINAHNSISLNGTNRNGRSSGVLTTTFRDASGTSGTIRLNTNSFQMAGRSVINAQTFNASQGGAVIINADNFAARNGAQIRTTTSANGAAGNITLISRNNVLLSGTAPTSTSLPQQSSDADSTQVIASGLLANTAPNSRGSGGTIRITTPVLTVQDGARVVVNSQGSGVAGNLNVTARSITLSNEGRLVAEATSVNGGNINLQELDQLLLRRSSQISTTAGNNRNGGNGGNISVDADFIIAIPSENSDITANAFQGNGGRVEIATQGLFGITPRAFLTDLSDITASSQQGIQGVVAINTPDVDPSRGLTELPTDLNDTSQLIAQNCSTGGQANELGEFIITGRGGLPPNPTELLGNETVLTSLIDLPDDEDTGVQRNASLEETDYLRPLQSSISNSQPPIVEAQGWILGEQEEVILLAQVPAGTPRFPASATSCSAQGST
jgi:filamentous hemagglutinin family protein